MRKRTSEQISYEMGSDRTVGENHGPACERGRRSTTVPSFPAKISHKSLSTHIKALRWILGIGRSSVARDTVSMQPNVNGSFWRRRRTSSMDRFRRAVIWLQTWQRSYMRRRAWQTEAGYMFPGYRDGLLMIACLLTCLPNAFDGARILACPYDLRTLFFVPKVSTAMLWHESTCVS